MPLPAAEYGAGNPPPPPPPLPPPPLLIVCLLDLRDFLAQCSVRDPAQRPTLSTLKEHAFLTYRSTCVEEEEEERRKEEEEGGGVNFLMFVCRAMYASTARLASIAPGMSRMDPSTRAGGGGGGKRREEEEEEEEEMMLMFSSRSTHTADVDASARLVRRRARGGAVLVLSRPTNQCVESICC